MFAIIETGGKQYKVSEGDTIFVEKLDCEADSEIVFDQVKAISKGEEFVVGSPVIDGAKVTAKVLSNGKARKIYVFTYKAKKNEKRKMGHRQPYTKVSILKIEG
ncbi:MAG: 50S ribosomal protein L21 [Clostridia bacterium]|nr:50S ribosomal protein L21 [Clostridia bacterium]